MSARSSPPRARLAFRVGVVGHRPDRLAQADVAVLESRMADVLGAVRLTVQTFAASWADAEFYAQGAPICRATSALAEGTDRLFAKVALSLGYELCCPMPFRQQEYEQDFLPGAALEPASLETFRDVLQQARAGQGLTAFELDGDRQHASRAYGAAGRVVLNQSDLLIAVWDGGPAAGPGGTLQTLTEAVLFHVPVLWIDAVKPHPWRWLRSAEDLDRVVSEDQPRRHEQPPENREALADAVRQIVLAEIALPRPSPDRPHEPDATAGIRDYFDERQPSVNGAFAWKMFREAVSSRRLTWPGLRVQAFEARIAPAWPIGPGGHGPDTATEAVNRRLRPHFAWSDQLADLKSDAYRSGYVVAFLLAAVAVLLALVPTAAHWPGSSVLSFVCTIGELVTLLTIIGLFYWAVRRRWHERWLEYRLLAELVRQMRFLMPLGGARPFPHVPAHAAAYGDPTQTWMYWHVRAVARAAGLPNVTVTPAYVRECLDYIEHVVRDPVTGQRAFHEANEQRSNHIAHRLHRWTLTLLWLTVGGVLVHLLPHVLPGDVPGLEHLEAGESWLVLLSACAPALGAALAGINNQGEFARVAKRSAAMAARFARFGEEIDFLRRRAGGPAGLAMADVVPLAAQIATVMVDEVADWRVVFMDRPPTAT